MYSPSFTATIVQTFIQSHPRGWAYLCTIYDDLSYDRAIHEFNAQKHWWYFKRVIQLADELLERGIDEKDNYLRSVIDNARQRYLDAIKKKTYNVRAVNEGRGELAQANPLGFHLDCIFNPLQHCLDLDYDGCFLNKLGYDYDKTAVASAVEYAKSLYTSQTQNN